MKKLKKLIKEHTWDRKFGDPLPTFEDVMKKHQVNKFKEDLDSVGKEDDDVDNDGDSDASDDYLKNRRDVISKAIEKESIKEGWWENMSDAAQKAYIKKHGEAPGSAGGDEDDYDMGEVPGSRGTGPWTPEDDPDFEKGPSLTSAPGRVPDEDDEDDYDMGEVPGSREEWEDIEPGDPEMRSGDESAEELGDLMKQQQNHIEDMFEKGADREDIEAAEGNLEDLEREYDEKVESGEDVGTSYSDKGVDPVTGLSARTGNELNQETLMIDGKQYNRISEGVEKQPKPKYEFSEFYQRFKRQE